MLIVEIGIYSELIGGTNYSPFVRQYKLTLQTLATFWTGTFGVEDDQTATDHLYVLGVIGNSIYRYARKTSLADCVAEEQSFYWDGSDILYVHYAHADDEWCTIMEYSTPAGFTDKRLIYVGDVCYKPLLRGAPSIAQQQEWLGYDQLSRVNGTFVFDNVGAAFDFAISQHIFGNDVFLYYLVDTGADDYSRDDLVPMAAFYVENYEHTLKEFSVDVEDQRVAQNTKILTELFTQAVYPTLADEYEQTPVPLLYGLVRASTAVPVATDPALGVTFRQAVTLTSLGTVQVWHDDAWYTVVPTSSDLARGEFTLAYMDATDSGGNPYECEVVGSVGIPVTHASDVILDLNQRFLNMAFNDSNYDTAEWAAEEIALEPVGIAYNEQIELFEAIRMIQAGSNVGFRYEIAADGRRTIRINDWERATAKYVPNVRMYVDELPVSSTDDTIAAEVVVSYAPDFHYGKSLTVRDTDNAESVLRNFRSRASFPIDTFLCDSPTAAAAAAWYAGRLDAIHGGAELVLRGVEYLTARIYDVLEVELTPAFVDRDTGIITGREYYGIWRVQVLAVDPNEDRQENTVRAILIEEVEI
jgi:hypothetical protein